MTSTVGRATDPRAQRVWLERDMLWVRLADGRELGVPLVWVPSLAEAPAGALSRYEIIDQGYGIHWPELDEDISVLALLGQPD